MNIIRPPDNKVSIQLQSEIELDDTHGAYPIYLVSKSNYEILNDL